MRGCAATFPEVEEEEAEGREEAVEVDVELEAAGVCDEPLDVLLHDGVDLDERGDEAVKNTVGERGRGG
mgnify:CR=1 FL=1